MVFIDKSRINNLYLSKKARKNIKYYFILINKLLMCWTFEIIIILQLIRVADIRDFVLVLLNTE